MHYLAAIGAIDQQQLLKKSNKCHNNTNNNGASPETIAYSARSDTRNNNNHLNEHEVVWLSEYLQSSVRHNYKLNTQILLDAGADPEYRNAAGVNTLKILCNNRGKYSHGEYYNMLKTLNTEDHSVTHALYNALSEGYLGYTMPEIASAAAGLFALGALLSIACSPVLASASLAFACTTLIAATAFTIGAFLGYALVVSLEHTPVMLHEIYDGSATLIKDSSVGNTLLSWIGMGREQDSKEELRSLSPEFTFG